MPNASTIGLYKIILTIIAKTTRSNDYAGETKGLGVYGNSVRDYENKKGPVVHIYTGPVYYATMIQRSPKVLMSSEKPEGMVIPIPELEVFLCG